MRFTQKIGIGAVSSILIAIGLFFYELIYFFTADPINLLIVHWVLAISVLAMIFGGVIGLIGMGHLVNETIKFRSKIKYCYSCGYSLGETSVIELCPKCNANLNLLDLIDV